MKEALFRAKQMITLDETLPNTKQGPRQATKATERAKKMEFLALFLHLFASCGKKCFTVAGLADARFLRSRSSRS